MLAQACHMRDKLSYVESGELLPILIECVVVELDELLCAFVSGTSFECRRMRHSGAGLGIGSRAGGNVRAIVAKSALFVSLHGLR